MGCILKGGGGLYSRLVVGAVLNAAGPAARVDGRPVGLLELGGVPLVRRQLIALSGAGVDEVVVVLDEGTADLEPVVQSFPITLARHAGGADAAGPWRTGLAALAGKLDAVLLLGVEHPLLNTQDLVDLIGAYKKRSAGVDRVVPSVEGTAGRPVVIAAALREAVLVGATVPEALVGPDDAIGVVPAAATAGAAHAWATDNRRYLTRVAGAEALARFERDTGHALRWPSAASLA